MAIILPGMKIRPYPPPTSGAGRDVVKKDPVDVGIEDVGEIGKIHPGRQDVPGRTRGEHPLGQPGQAGVRGIQPQAHGQPLGGHGLVPAVVNLHLARRPDPRGADAVEQPRGQVEDPGGGGLALDQGHERPKRDMHRPDQKRLGSHGRRQAGRRLGLENRHARACP